nr:dephospho-CoA kinase [Maliibacterium massiliense]
MPSSVRVIGVTGGMASGKSTLVAHLAARGGAVVDADVVARDVVLPESEGARRVRARFGDAFFDEKGALKRRALAEHIYADAQARKDLNALLHPLILAEMARRRDAALHAGAPFVVMDAALMFETGADALCDEVWAITLRKDIQAARIMRREGVDKRAAIARINAQMRDSVRRMRADAVIDNGGTVQDACNALDALLIARGLYQRGEEHA